MQIARAENLSKTYRIKKKRTDKQNFLKDILFPDYEDIKAVDDVNFQIESGEAIGFIGPNGAGKSTTIKLMTGIVKPTRGNITIDGCDPFTDRLRNVQNIGVVFGQRSQLWWELPVCDSFSILKEIYRIPPKDYDENIRLFDELLGLKTLFRMPVRYLSLGQRMLCDIAAAFLHNPKIIFLDEPTIGLDINIKNKIRGLIRDLNKVRKTTVILTSHDIADIEALCTRILIIDRGKIIYNDKINNISNLFGSFRVLKIDIPSYTIKDIESMTKILNGIISDTGDLKIETDVNNWIEITFNDQKIKLLSILDLLSKNFLIKDIKTEDIKIETVIARLYESRRNA